MSVSKINTWPGLTDASSPTEGKRGVVSSLRRVKKSLTFALRILRGSRAEAETVALCRTWIFFFPNSDWTP